MCAHNLEDKNSHTIKFKQTDDILLFVQRLIKDIPCNVNAVYENQIVDAKSLVGLVNMSIHPIKVYANTNDDNVLGLFNKICEDYKE